MTAPLPTIEGGFRCILADWPSRFASNSAAKPGRNAMRHYDCMTPAECAAMPVREICAPDCWLFLWMTGPFLAIGAHKVIMDGWGFKPSSIAFVWDKQAMGTGFTTRQSVEFIVLGRRGKPTRLAADVRQFYSERRTIHSRKPGEFHSRIERFCAGPRLEMFARQSRENWVTWGEQSTLFD